LAAAHAALDRAVFVIRILLTTASVAGLQATARVRWQAEELLDLSESLYRWAGVYGWVGG